jgi:ankyrin repeat protein
MANFLVTKRAKLNVADKSGDTPLHLAIPGGDVELVRLMVSQGADVNARNGAGKTPYTLCAENNNAPMAQIILAAGGFQ